MIPFFFFPPAKFSTLWSRYKFWCWWLAEARELKGVSCSTPGRKCALVVTETIIDLLHRRLHVYYPESSKVLASPCIPSLRIQKGKDASPNAKLKSSLVVKMRRALVLCCGLTVQSALSITASKATELWNNVCLCRIPVHLSSKHEQKGWERAWLLDTTAWSAYSHLQIPPDHIKAVHQCLTTGNGKSAATSGAITTAPEGVNQPFSEAPVGVPLCWCSFG